MEDEYRISCILIYDAAGGTEQEMSILRRLLQQARPFSSTISTLGSLLLVWEAAGRVFEIKPAILPTPTRILLEIWDQGSKLRPHGLISAYEIAGGFLLAAICAIPAAYVIGLVPGIRRSAIPILSILRPAPLLIVAPLMFVWFGYGVRPEIFIAFVPCFVTITAGMTTGLRSIDPELKALLETMGASRTQMFLKLYLPATLPSLFEALRSAVPLAVVGATTGEFAQAEMGLGYLLLAGAFKMETPLVFAALTVLGAIGLVLYLAVALLEFLTIRWHVEMTQTGVVSA